jgi:hypothetical protein
MCQIYSIKEKVVFFFVRPLNTQWSLCYNFIHVYFIIIFNEKVGLNTILTNQFQTYLFPTFVILKFLKFCSWFTINPIGGSILFKWNLSKIWIYFLVFSWKTTSFLIWYFFGNFFYILYHAFTHIPFFFMVELNDIHFHPMFDGTRSCNISNLETLKIKVTYQRRRELRVLISKDHVCE